jgi:hypothetical protein
MKLRLDKDRVRLRLTSDEKKVLKANKSITEQFHISAENQFTYSIQVVDYPDTCVVTFESNSLEIKIPNVMADKWMDSNQVGIKETIITDEGGKIVLFVEEDLPPRKSRDKK